MPQLSQMSSGAQDTGPPPELRGTEVQLVFAEVWWMEDVTGKQEKKS